MTPTTPTPAFAFASDVLGQLQKIVRGIPKEGKTKSFYSSLVAGIADINLSLADVGEDRVILLETRLPKLLINLEKFCQWPACSNVPSSRGSSFDPGHFPTLGSLSVRRTAVKNAIKEFASDPRAAKHRKALLNLLETFEKRKHLDRGPEVYELESTGPQERQEDYQVYIRSLYAGLSRHCLCQQEDGVKYITANLQLKGCCTPGEMADAVNFRLFFLDHPHFHNDDEHCRWQDTQVCVRRLRGIKFEHQAGSRTIAGSGQPITVDTFCKTITNRTRSQLKLEISGSGLVLQGPGGLSRNFLLDSSSLSLAQILDVAKLSREKKLLLSYYLAKAVWQFYDSAWMQSEWTKEKVHFMFERRSNTPKGIFINEPFLSVRFADLQEANTAKEDFRSHLFPKILALGIMFLEIEFGIKIEDYRLPEDIGLDGQPTVNADHIAAIEMFNKEELWEEKDTPRAFRSVIGICLIPDDFQCFLNDVQDLRGEFEKRIVNPLQKLYIANSLEHPEVSQVRPIQLTTSPTNCPEPFHREAAIPTLATPAAHHIIYQSPHPEALAEGITMPFIQSFRASHSLTPLSDGTMSQNPSGYSSDNWFEEMDKLNFILRPKPRDKEGSYKPVRIAILDTGVSEDYGDSHSIKAYKDFVDPHHDEDYQDTTGHGTIAFRLIQKVYKLAEIYIGRVFRNSTAESNTVALMAEAIKHAKTEWAVDIIVMPSGFKYWDKNLDSAITEARNANILIFAAASNYGNVVNIAFPGRLYIDLKLFCMFSTGPNVRALSSFNPSVLSNARYSFAILGENITLPKLDKLLSGTSYSTMIGAALAARLLDFSRHKDIRDNIRFVDKLHTVEGMSAIFERMVEGAVDNGYHCMAPWKLIPSEVEDEEPAQKRKREREYICETISRALEDMHRR